MNTIALRIAATLAALLSAVPGLAHDGHGLVGSHWHSTDAWGPVIFGAAVGVAAWFSRGGKP